MPSQELLDAPSHRHLETLEHRLERGDRSLVSIESFLLQLICQILREPDHVHPGTPAWLSKACRAATEPQVFRNGAAGFVKVAGRAHELFLLKVEASSVALPLLAVLHFRVYSMPGANKSLEGSAGNW